MRDAKYNGGRPRGTNVVCVGEGGVGGWLASSFLQGAGRTGDVGGESSSFCDDVGGTETAGSGRVSRCGTRPPGTGENVEVRPVVLEGGIPPRSRPVFPVRLCLVLGVPRPDVNPTPLDEDPSARLGRCYLHCLFCAH